MKRPYLFSKLDIPNKAYEVEHEVMLWRSVLDQALQDYFVDCTTEDDYKNQQAAKIWLRGNTIDFYEVCQMAMLDVKQVKRIIEDMVGGRNKLFT